MRSTTGVGAVVGLGAVDDWLINDWLPGVAVEKLDVAIDDTGFANGN